VAFKKQVDLAMAPIRSHLQKLSSVLKSQEHSQLIETYDYSTRIPGPSSIIDSQGYYIPGWFDSFEGAHNFEDASGSDKRFQKWIHIHFETKQFFVVANIAHMGLGGNIAILLHDKKTGKTEKSSTTRYLLTNRISCDSMHSHFEDAQSGSRIHLHADGSVDFDVRAKTLTFQGRAVSTLGKPFIQSTVYSPGMGTLQWWGNLCLEHGSVKRAKDTLTLEPGSLGAYDRTVGHRPQEQNWNWVSAVGEALEETSDKKVTFSLQVSKEKEKAKPRVHSQKYNLWLGETHTKFDDLTIDYTADPQSRDTGKWKILGVGKDDSLNLSFRPHFHRREQKWLPGLLDIDFNQYYGTLAGRLVSAGKAYRIQKVFTVCEDSRMNIKV
jgi:hypothetical protein